MDESTSFTHVVLPILAVFCGLVIYIIMKSKKSEPTSVDGSHDTEVEAYIKANGMNKGFVIERQLIRPMVYLKVPGGIKFFIPKGDELDSLWHDNGGKYQNWYFGSDDGKCSHDWHTKWWSEEAELVLNKKIPETTP